MTSSSSTPDIASLSLSSQPSQQRLHDTYDFEGSSGNGRSPYHFSTSPPIPAQSQYNPLGINSSPLKNKPLRAGLPSQWLDNSAVLADNRSLSPPNNSDLSSSGGSPPMGHMHVVPITPGTPNIGADDEIIPTAIVIKNIPFNVKRDTLLDIIASLAIPTPYAFNYHLDQSGQFRGLAFANFRQAADADAVVAALNGFDVQGRKLRVEYKKVLQAGEKERIEREKAIRRMRSMQLEKEQAAMQQQSYDEFGPVLSTPFTPQRSFSASSVYQNQQYSPPQIPQMPPMPTPQLYGVSTPPPMPSVTPNSAAKSSSAELDLNDPSTLEIYSRILLFKDDRMRDELAFSRTLSPKQRRVVHLVAQKLGVYHYSVGEGDERYAVVTRIDPATQQANGRQTISRAPSSYLSATSGMPVASLRMKKSMPDMKTLQAQAPRLNTRSSNGNIREGYATIASPSRRSPGAFAALFGNGAFGNGVPPVPTLPASVVGLSNGGSLDSPMVVRQPRGPGVGGFESRRERRESQSRSGFEARSHEPLEI
ncbi:RNA-binding post-transcriptional regulator cip2 [Grifola frondosa]|uniref:RNA-binding post-transcriptional regulator cip2 n=1 Tax=Grifola frondosa TaxID=5627 RepID=A0A1C7MG54_GRIFR|nr:RNA-binding post-transcriptional regulator cip2 [Grifola frondosa]